jgi:excinuclease ABC subunit B
MNDEVVEYPGSPFRLHEPFAPAGDQPEAIRLLTEGIGDGLSFQTLLGVTGSGKTYTMANVIARLGRPALVLAHNKTLAAQLYSEFREFFPENAVEYFVSYYDYYQPEAYIPQRDIYIEKDASRNDDLDRLRLSATTSLTSRRDVIVVASVSCIFGLGSPEDYKSSVVNVRVGTKVDRDELLRRFVDLQYQRNDMDFKRGTFRVRGDTVEIRPAYEEFGYRIEFWGDDVERIEMINPTTSETIAADTQMFLYPAVHYVMPEDKIAGALDGIENELNERLGELKRQGKLLEAQRLYARTKYDLEMIREVGYCSGIENYSRHLAGMPAGSRPYTLIDYFPKDFLLIIDESHVTIPQVHAMYAGDRNRKEVLVEHGFRLPSCLDNRPLRFEEFEQLWNQVMFVSATPNKFELEKSGGEVVEQIIRPTGLVDPPIVVRSARGQVQDLLEAVKQRSAVGERVLITTLTKRLAEDLSGYMQQQGLKTEYLHSEIDTLERVEILRELREGKFDVLVGVNLLREGLDLPEVSLVAILDADKEGFLRSATSLIQTIGRCARNVNAEVILYADTITPSMKQAMDETNRRREVQLKYNQENNITPETIRKEIRRGLELELAGSRKARETVHMDAKTYSRTELLEQMTKEMLEAAERLEFEVAAGLRDKIQKLKDAPVLVGAEGEEWVDADALEAGTSRRGKNSKGRRGPRGTRRGKPA